MNKAIDEIRACRSFDELRRLWDLNRDLWSQLPVEQAKEIIAAKETKKLSLAFQDEVDRIVGWLNSYWKRKGIEMEDIPLGQRQRAVGLEREMTIAADAGDIETAGAALERWRACWVPPSEGGFRSC